MRIFSCFIVASMLVIASGSESQAGHDGCGCGSAASCNSPHSANCCRHHHLRRCCCDGSKSEPRGFEPRDTKRDVVPSAPVVSSMPMMMMPVMFGMSAQRATFSEPRSQRDDCEERLGDLEERVEALHLRMKTLERSIEMQTLILEELRDKGTIGGKSPAVSPQN